MNQYKMAEEISFWQPVKIKPINVVNPPSTNQASSNSFWAKPKPSQVPNQVSTPSPRLFDLKPSSASKLFNLKPAPAPRLFDLKSSVPAPRLFNIKPAQHVKNQIIFL